MAPACLSYIESKQGAITYNVLNDQSDNIGYNIASGEFVITEPGNYNVAWWTAPDGAGAATSISFAKR